MLLSVWNLFTKSCRRQQPLKERICDEALGTQFCLSKKTINAKFYVFLYFWSVLNFLPLIFVFCIMSAAHVPETQFRLLSETWQAAQGNGKQRFSQNFRTFSVLFIHFSCWKSNNVECPLCWKSTMLKVHYVECPLCWMSPMLNVHYVECPHIESPNVECPWAVPTELLNRVRSPR